MENDLKEFMEKVKDEFKKMRAALDELSGRVSVLEKGFELLLIEGKEKKKDDSWF